MAITGAAFQATLDGKAIPLWQSFKACKGSELAIGKVEGEAGCRGYIAVGGGIDVPLYLGSRSTFPGGKLGGLQVGACLPSVVVRLTYMCSIVCKRCLIICHYSLQHKQ